jgi:hypothetical protein
LKKSRGLPDSDEEKSDDSTDANYEPSSSSSSKTNTNDLANRGKRKRKNELITDSTPNTHNTQATKIPTEILQKIFKYVLLKNIACIQQLSLVCKSWHEVCKDNTLWSNICMNQRIDFNGFLSFALNENKFCFTKILNLSNSNELTSESLELIVQQTNNNLTSLNISNCVKIKCESLKHIADYCPSLQHLDISALSVSIFSVGLSTTHLIKIVFFSMFPREKSIQKSLHILLEN